MDLFSDGALFPGAISEPAFRINIKLRRENLSDHERRRLEPGVEAIWESPGIVRARSRVDAIQLATRAGLIPTYAAAASAVEVEESEVRQ